MNIKFGATPVGNSQKVAENLRQAESKRAFSISWNQALANIGQVVGINGIVNFAPETPANITVKILFEDKPFAEAEKVEINNGKISAQWKVTPFRAGNFTSGKYDVEVRYSGVSAKSQVSLKIISSLVSWNVSSFG